MHCLMKLFYLNLSFVLHVDICMVSSYLLLFLKIFIIKKIFLLRVF